MGSKPGESGIYIDDFGLDWIWKKIKNNFIKKSDASVSGNRDADSIVAAVEQGQVNSSTFAITEKSITTTNNTVKAKIQYNSDDDSIDFIFN